MRGRGGKVVAGLGAGGRLLDVFTLIPRQRVFRHSGDLRSGHAAGSETRAERGLGAGGRLLDVFTLIPRQRVFRHLGDLRSGHAAGSETRADRVKAQDCHRSAGPNARPSCDSPNHNEVAQWLRHGERDGVWVMA